MLKNLIYSIMGITGALLISAALVICSPVLLNHYGNALIASSSARVDAETQFSTLRPQDVKRRLELDQLMGLDDIKAWAERIGIRYYERASLFFNTLDLFDYPEDCFNTLLGEHRLGHFYVYKSRRVCPADAANDTGVPS
ncbi:MAG: hypothetical protein JXQ97_00565 [Natronospirillum sp.]